MLGLFQIFLILMFQLYVLLDLILDELVLLSKSALQIVDFILFEI